MIAQIRLSSNDVMMEWDYASVRPWKDKIPVVAFSYCSPDCKHKGDHDYKFDGQVFYRNFKRKGVE